ncbi:surface-adhesin E family protein [Sphingobium yanoikuyae]
MWRLAATVLLAICPSVRAQEANDWVVIDQSDELIVLINPQSIKTLDSGVRAAWVKYHYAHPEDAIYSKVVRYRYRCDEEMSAIESYVDYDRSGNLKSTRTLRSYELDWRPSPPDTIGSALISAVCKF